MSHWSLKFNKPAPAKLLAPLRMAWRDWLKQDAPVIGYLLKVLLACLLAMWLSLRFELDQPRTAMLTVAIVMQSRSGMVFSKSYYRLLGTLVGIVVSFLLVAMFAQERILFLWYMALWIGLCTAGSMIYRNHQSYAFVLAGYTICIVGLPATIDPNQTFAIGVTRISEILIGLFSATLVSDLIFPQRMWDAMLTAVRRRFKDFSDLLRSSAASSKPTKPVLLRFIGDIFSLESFRASAVMENDESRHYHLRFKQMNNEFMAVSTTLHAFEQLLRRQRSHAPVCAALQDLYQALADSISIDGHSAASEHEALKVDKQLLQFRNSFASRVAHSRQQLAAELSSQASVAFETGVELLARLADELHVYAATYSSLGTLNTQADSSATLKATSDDSPTLTMHFDPLAVTIAGIRGALALALLSTIWILTDWQSGIEAITLGVISSTLFATTPSPTNTIKKFFTGAVIGTVLAYWCNFHWLTHAQGFVMLSLAVAPGLLLAAWLTTSPAIATIGSGTFIVFLMHIGFNSSYSANPVVFMNDAIADLFAVLVSGMMYGLIDLSTSRWSRQRSAAALRELVVNACTAPLPLRRTSLEAAARDLVQRAGSAQRSADDEDRAVVDWLLSVLEIGHAVIALREHISQIDHQSSHSGLAASINTCLESIANLYTSPSPARLEHAIGNLENSLYYLYASETLYDPAILDIATATRRKIQTTLHYLHSALLDDTAVFSEHRPGYGRPAASLMEPA